MVDKISLKLTGFAELKGALKGAKFKKALEKHVGRATGRSSKMLEREVRQAIKKGGFSRNAALTTAIKHSSKPLVDKGDLWQAVKAEQPSWDLARIGVNYKHGAYDIAKLLHDGGDIPVTAKMRTMFFYLWLASLAKKGLHSGPPPILRGRAIELFARYQDWKPLKGSTRAIHIPPRGFLIEVAGKREIRQRVIDAWQKAVEAAFREVAGK